jgi:hypothetical protein
MQLFTRGWQNPKTAKSLSVGYDTLILHLAPARLSGYEVCSSRSPGCTIGCLNTSGHGKTNVVQQARINRTLLFFNNRTEFKNQAYSEINSFLRRCVKHSMQPAIRLNGTSDLVWETLWPEIFSDFSGVQFYDYTKYFKRCLPSYKLPENYHLTFSRSEKNEQQCELVLENGACNVVVVFKNKNFPDSYKSYPTYSADETDLRFLDPKGGHVGCLYAKGKAKHDTTGFVLQAT